MTDPSPPAPLRPDRPRWLATGGSGRVGRMVRRAWAEAPPAATLLMPQRRAGDVPGGLVWDPLAGDLPEGVGPVDTLIALAGITPASGQPLELNTALAVATLTAARRHGIGRVLLTSSSAVYGAPAGDAPLSEDSPLRPLNPYGAAKLAMEAACAPFRDAGVEVCCLRIGNVAGADALLLNAATARPDQPIRLDRFAGAAAETDPDGPGPIRSYLGPATLARVLAGLAAAPGPLPAALNVALPHPVGMADLAEAAELPWLWQPAPAGALRRLTLDVGRLARLYRFTPAEGGLPAPEAPAADPDPTRPRAAPLRPDAAALARDMVHQWHRLKDPA